MAYSSEFRNEARRLRSEGHFSREIARELGVANSTVFGWIRDVPVNPEIQGPMKPKTPQKEAPPWYSFCEDKGNRC